MSDANDASLDELLLIFRKKMKKDHQGAESGPGPLVLSEPIFVFVARDEVAQPGVLSIAVDEQLPVGAFAATIERLRGRRTEVVIVMDRA